MKKILLTFTVIASLAISASAQLAVGVKAGLNLANVGGDAEDTDMRASFHLGGYINVPLAGSLSLQPELLYNSVGAKSKNSDTYSAGGVTYKDTDESTVKFSYVSIPVLLQYSFGPVNIHAGPQISFLASAKADVETSSYENGVLTTSFSKDGIDVKDGYKGLDLGINIGAGVNFGKLSATARYCAGIANIAENDNGGDYKLTNNVIQLSVGYRLFGGK